MVDAWKYLFLPFSKWPNQKEWELDMENQSQKDRKKFLIHCTEMSFLVKSIDKDFVLHLFVRQYCTASSIDIESSLSFEVGWKNK